MCFRNNGLHIQEKNGASGAFVLRSACCGSPWRPVHSAGTLPMYSSGFRKHPCSEKSPSGIIFPMRTHPCQKKSTAGDYFLELKASLPEEIPRQGLFPRGRCIPARRNPPPGIIFPSGKHPCSKKCSPRDYFPEVKASLLEEFHRQGLFPRGESIPTWPTGNNRMILWQEMHPRAITFPYGVAIMYRFQQNQENAS